VLIYYFRKKRDLQAAVQSTSIKKAEGVKEKWLQTLKHYQQDE
jgi:hypothetical protein